MSPDFLIEQDTKQSDVTTAKVCRVNPEHGRLTVMGNGLALTCGNRIKEAEAKSIAERGGAIAKLENSKQFVCGYTESIVG